MKRIFVATLTIVAVLACLSLLTTSRQINKVAAQGKADLPEQAQDAPGIVRIHELNPHGADNVTAGGTASLSPISYHNGPLISTPTAYVIWYGNWNQTNGTDNAAGQQIVRDFLSNIGNSNYYAINKTYSKNGYNITGGVNFVGGTYSSTNPNGCETTDTGSQGTRLTDSRVLSVVNSAITQGKLPYNPDGVYFVLTSSNVSESSGFCTQYCGWHTAATPTAGHVRYSFVGNAARCINSCAAQSVSPNNNPGVDGMISVIAHELEEANTDPDPRSGWADASGAENADKCAWTFGQNQTTLSNGSVYNVTLGTRHYLIQRNLSATDNKCYIDGVLGLQ
jgi:hypothetical protein